jgi:hypothetical protein
MLLRNMRRKSILNQTRRIRILCIMGAGEGGGEDRSCTIRRRRRSFGNGMMGEGFVS